MSFKGLQLADTAFLARSAAPAGPMFPDELAGLVRWYKADTFALADGTAIGDGGNEWADQSPTAPNNATQTGGSRPVFRTNVFGSMPAVEFVAASAHWLSMPDISLNDDFTIIVIGKVTADSTILGKDFTNYQIRIYRSSANTISFYVGGVDIVSDVFAAAQTSVRMMGWRRLGTVLSLREANISRGDIGDGAATSFVLDALGLSNGGAELCTGHFGEICVWNQNHSDFDVDALFTNYFQGRFGLP